MNWRALLEGDGEPSARVAAARDQGFADPKGAIEGLAAVASDAAASATTRVLALAALGRVAAHARAALPDLADVVGDDAIIGTALALGMPDALTGVLARLGDGPYPRIIRKLVGFRLVAAGVHGPHVSRLLLDAGELDGAARAIADDFVIDVLHAVRSPSAVALAWATDVTAALDRHGAALAESLRACLARRPGAIDAMLFLFDQLGDAAAPARALLGRRTETN